MSRGFVKEGDQEELPVVPPRAALPPGTTNYVTPNGYKELLQEREDLEEEKRNLSKENDREYRHAKMFIDGKLNLLNARIASARIIDEKNPSEDKVRFGAIVKYGFQGRTATFQIVGVDEANIKKKKIAFTAPIARAMIGKRKNETFPFKRGQTVQTFKILDIRYPQEENPKK